MLPWRSAAAWGIVPRWSVRYRARSNPDFAVARPVASSPWVIHRALHKHTQGCSLVYLAGGHEAALHAQHLDRRALEDSASTRDPSCRGAKRGPRLPRPLADAAGRGAPWARQQRAVLVRWRLVYIWPTAIGQDHVACASDATAPNRPGSTGRALQLPAWHAPHRSGRDPAMPRCTRTMVHAAFANGTHTAQVVGAPP